MQIFIYIKICLNASMIQLNENGAMNFENKIIFIDAKNGQKSKDTFLCNLRYALLIEKMKYRQKV